MNIYFPIKKGAIKKFFKEKVEYPADPKPGIGMAIVFIIAMGFLLGPIFLFCWQYNKVSDPSFAAVSKILGIILCAIGVIGYFTLLILTSIYGDK